MTAQLSPRPEVRSALDEVLSRAEFRRDGDELGRALDGLGESFGEALQVLARGLGRLLPALLLVALALWLWRARRRAAFPAAQPPQGPPDPVRRARAAWSEAREARARGDAARALRLFFFALVAGLGASGELVFREAWTDRELLRRGAPKEGARRLLEELVGELEPKVYGGRPITEADLERLEGLCRAHLAPEAAP